MSAISMTGEIASWLARPLMAAPIDADQASFANLVAAAPIVDVESAEARVNDGAMVSALEPAPVTSVALPALIASEAVFCAPHGVETANASRQIEKVEPSRKT